jgi:UDP-N-acetyl-D-mannosaminuronic acid dehydrogenase
LRDSLNTKWNVNILEPRDGIGGHCLPKDTKMFLSSSKSIKSKIIEAAIQVDSEYRKYRGKSQNDGQSDTDRTDTLVETQLEISPDLLALDK